jgi:hypothetical protein
MSVVKSKRDDGELVVVTKANELATYTIHICSNENHFPKRYRWCITNKLVDAALDINNCIIKANSVFVRDRADYQLRKRYQTEGLAATYSLLGMIDIAYRTFGIESDRVKHWTGLALDVQNLMRNWRKNDIERYEKLG